MARVNAKNIYTRLLDHHDTMTVLLKLQTQHFILIVSLPADLLPLSNKNTLTCYDPIHKNNITCCALSIGKTKNVYFSARGIAIPWFFSI